MAKCCSVTLVCGSALAYRRHIVPFILGRDPVKPLSNGSFPFWKRAQNCFHITMYMRKFLINCDILFTTTLLIIVSSLLLTKPSKCTKGGILCQLVNPFSARCGTESAPDANGVFETINISLKDVIEPYYCKTPFSKFNFIFSAHHTNFFPADFANFE